MFTKLFQQFINFIVYSYWKINIGNKPIVLDPTSTISLFSKLRLINGGSIIIGKESHIHDYAMVLTYGGTIKIGSHFSLNPFSILYGHGGIKIGNNVRIAAHTVVVAANHVFKDKKVPIRLQGLTTKGITIGDDVWIGANCTILDGVRIGNGCVIGAGSVVKKSIKDYTIAAGSPARILSQRRGKE